MDFMASDDFITLILIAPFAAISFFGIILLIYMACRKPNRYSSRTKKPDQYINHTPSHKLGGDKTSVRRLH